VPTTPPVPTAASESRRHSFDATAGAGGELWLALGVWGTFETPRTYSIDDVAVVFTPR
jgi:hypothetical protein